MIRVDPGTVMHSLCLIVYRYGMWVWEGPVSVTIGWSCQGFLSYLAEAAGKILNIGIKRRGAW